MKKIWIFAIIITGIVGVLLVGGTWYINTPVSCDHLIDHRLQNGLDNTKSTLPDWIRDTYLFANLDMKERGPKDSRWLSWSSLKNKYRAVNDGNSIYQYWSYKKVQVKDVLRCLNEPEAYSGTWDTSSDVLESHFSLWYPQHGYVFTSGMVYTAEKITINPDSRVFFVGVVEPSLLAAVVQSAYPTNEWGEKLYSDTITTLKEWPDDFQEIELENSNYVKN